MSYWVVNSCVEKPSKIMPNATVWHIEFVDIQTREHRVTYVEKRFKNYRNWLEIIDSYPLGLIVTNLKQLNGKRINADSKPEILFAVPQSELADIIAEYWNDN
jgi:hypothetical protein